MESGHGASLLDGGWPQTKLLYQFLQRDAPILCERDKMLCSFKVSGFDLIREAYQFFSFFCRKRLGVALSNQGTVSLPKRFGKSLVDFLQQCGLVHWTRLFYRTPLENRQQLPFPQWHNRAKYPITAKADFRRIRVVLLSPSRFSGLLVWRSFLL
jgi:hypothetical protein